MSSQVLKWDTPSHSESSKIVTEVFTYDRGADSRRQFALSGEQPHPFLEKSREREQADATDIAANNVAKRNFQKAYLDGWMATQEVSETGRPVDAVVSPVAPFAAARPGTFKYYGYTLWANALDYSACVIPVTTVDKTIDRVDENFRPQSDLARDIMDLCECDCTCSGSVPLRICCSC